MSEERLKIAVFIDFDNIEIGVKKTLNRHFDVGQVLEAIKERGEVVTKIAYGDWKHASDYSRALTQHAVHMVQRNLTPGGDKNGADITLALDALEMAFTRSHINAFVIVGGDSDFIALVEKLKQYDKMVFVVGGRSFTSSILQKNCHEFIAYENLIGIHPVVRKAAGRAPSTSTSPSNAQLRDALPPLRRALEILADREVSPQLGLLKSTLLQLDSTFSERDYGAHSFREFIQKMANAGFVNLKQVDRSLLVELKDGDSASAAAASAPAAGETEEEAGNQHPRRHVHSQPRDKEASYAREAGSQASGNGFPSEPAEAPAAPPGEPVEAPAALPSEPAEASLAASGAVALIRQIFEQMTSRPHWPMYLRTFKHYLRSADPSFDERRFGISNIHDLARQAQREGLLRIERNRQGILRLYPGEQFPLSSPSKIVQEVEMDEAGQGGAADAESAGSLLPDRLPFPEPPVEWAAEAVSGSPVEAHPSEEPPREPGAKPKRKRAAPVSTATRRRKAPVRKPRAPKKSSES